MQGRRAFSRLAAAAVLTLATASASAASERELAADIVAGIREGTVEWMTVGTDRFPVIVREPERAEAAGVVLIVPEPGAHADWPDVVRPLRLGLPRQGWQTVSVQMPRAAPDGDFHDEPRSRARLAFMLESLEAGGVERLVVLAHGRAYRLVVTLLAQAVVDSPKFVRGLVLVSPALPRPGALGEATDPLTTFDAPLLEIRGGEDAPQVAALMAEHARMASRGALPQRREVVVEGARGDFRAQAETLVRRVRGWLTTLPLAEQR